MVAPTFRTRGKIYNIPEPSQGYPRAGQGAVDPYSTLLRRDIVPNLEPSPYLPPGISSLPGFAPSTDPRVVPDDIAPEQGGSGFGFSEGIKPVATRDQIYMGRDIFSGQPERSTRYGGGAAPASRTPTARSPGVGYPAAPYGGGVPPQPQIPRARPDATPAPGLMPMRPQMPGISPFGQPVAPMAPFHGLDRPPEVNTTPRQPDVLPQQQTFRGIGQSPELMRMLQMLGGSFGGGG